jgi:hypothetical protein
MIHHNLCIWLDELVICSFHSTELHSKDETWRGSSASLSPPEKPKTVLGPLCYSELGLVEIVYIKEEKNEEMTVSQGEMRLLLWVISGFASQKGANRQEN